MHVVVTIQHQTINQTKHSPHEIEAAMLAQRIRGRQRRRSGKSQHSAHFAIVGILINSPQHISAADHALQYPIIINYRINLRFGP